MPTTFSGFAPSDLAFLSGLAANNDRDWFTAHRATYDDGLKPALEALIAATTAACAARKLPLGGEARRSLFRIHRDIRFSKDKRPYKSHVSATLTRDGGKLSPGLVYIHIEPEGGSRAAADAFDPDSIDPLDPSTHPSNRPAAAVVATTSIADVEDAYGHGPFVSAGFYLHERPNIEAFRRAVVADPAAWAAVEKALKKAGLTLAPGAAAKRMPKGFEAHAGTPLEPVLKRTQWFVRRPLTGAQITSPDLPDVIAGFATETLPLLRFGWSALDGR
ncbi:DUF2461 domain-containing protein [Brevundimonas lenta]|uniref:Uncharacterized protein (DUF2461 family) n=1 Tax=Brevundimonas lenta TaxID=424796 RepID=A0A7W6NRG0_9CAUL|nr:DUF2461 domain-containing protein [Brevundimonas lenta]MBB4084227.1 uncharacterized protein (DUF2461 family) [Brevundimonas lenta]